MTKLQDAVKLYMGGDAGAMARLGATLVWSPPIPVNTVLPAVSGATVPGDTATVTNGTWTNTPTSYAYQWQASIASVWTDLSGATATTLDTTGFDPGDYRCVVIASNASGVSAPAASNTFALSSGTALIFGSDAVPASGNGHANNMLLASKFVKTNSGAVTTAKVELSGQDGWHLAQIRFVALTDNAGVPGSVLWYTPALVPANASTEQTFTLPSDVSGTDAAGTYWLGVAVYELPGNTRGAPLTGVDTVLVSGFNVATPPSTSPAPGTTYEDYALRAWCDYLG